MSNNRCKGQEFCVFLSGSVATNEHTSGNLCHQYNTKWPRKRVKFR